MTRIYIAIGVLIVIGLGAWRYDYLVTSNSDLKRDLSAANANLEQSNSLLIKERQNAAKSALSAKKAYEEKQNDQIELDRLRKCVADKSCGVRVVRGACPAMPSSTATAGGIEATYAADRGKFEQDYFSLLESIKETKRRYDWMQAELIARSHPDYCNAK